MKNDYPMFANPYNGTNNRKKTRARIKADQSHTQSVPIFEKDEFGRPIKLLGYRYIKHFNR